MTLHLGVNGFALCMRNMDKTKAKERGFLTKEANAVTCKQCKYVLSRRFQRQVLLHQFPRLAVGEVRSIFSAREGATDGTKEETTNSGSGL